MGVSLRSIMKEYLEAIVRPLLQDPESLTINQIQDPMGVLLTISVAPRDMGRVIGKAGAHIQAMRTLMHMYGLISSAKISLKVLEPRGGKHYSEPVNENNHV